MVESGPVGPCSIMPVRAWRACQELKEAAALGEVQHHRCRAQKEPLQILVSKVLLSREWVQDQWVVEDGADDAFQHVKEEVQAGE